MPDRAIPMATADATPIGAENMSKDATENEQKALKRAGDSGTDATGQSGILTGIAQA